MHRDHAGHNWGRLVEIVDADLRTHQLAIAAEMFAGDGAEMRAELLRHGMYLSSESSPCRTARAASALDAAQANSTTNRLGWADDTFCSFVLGDGRVIGRGEVIYQNAHLPSPAREMRPSGTLSDWRDGISALCLDNPLLMLGVSSAFAGPLLEPLGMEGGGFHLRGASSRGKSTIQRAAVSVWGSPRLLYSWRATSNGLEGVAAGSNGTLLALDELAEVDAKELGMAAYMLANGQGKTRASKSGAARAPEAWRVRSSRRAKSARLTK